MQPLKMNIYENNGSRVQMDFPDRTRFSDG